MGVVGVEGVGVTQVQGGVFLEAWVGEERQLLEPRRDGFCFCVFFF